MRLLFAFIGSVVLIGAGGFVFAAASHPSPDGYNRSRGGGLALIVLGVVLLALALVAAANYNG